MIALRRLNKIPLPITNATGRYFTTQNLTSTIPSSASYDDLINAAGRKGDFATVRDLLCDRLSHGCVNTNNTFRFIATNVSVLEELLQNLASIGDWFTRKHAHDALVAQLSKLYRIAEALHVVDIMGRKNYGATSVTFHPIFIAVTRKKNMSVAWRVVERMRACKVKPDLVSFNYILFGYCIIGDVVSAADTLVKMEAEGINADANMYDALVLGACRARKVDGALAVMRRMMDDGVPALYSTHARIIKEMVRCGYYAPAIEYVRILAGRDEKLDVHNFGILARQLKCVKRIAEAASVVEEIVKRGLPIGLSPNFPVKDSKN